MTSNNDQEQQRREEGESWLEDRREYLVGRLLDNRPPVFAAPGGLDPRLAKWADDLADPFGPSRNLILTGPVGCGKTWSLWHAAERAVRGGFAGGVIFIKGPRFRHVVAPVSAEPDEFALWTRIGLLIFDDLGAARLSEWDRDNLEELIDTRWENQLPTVIASNFTNLRDMLGSRISSRLADGAVIVEMTGEGDSADRRRQR